MRALWQNGVGERCVGNCRRDLLDHVIVVNERHLKRLMSEYVRYYHDDCAPGWYFGEAQEVSY
jgi:putative transposase